MVAGAGLHAEDREKVANLAMKAELKTATRMGVAV